MMHTKRDWGRLIAASAAVAVGLGLFAAPGTANAWWRGGVFIGAPVVVGPVYPPPVYYPPPPVYYAPPPPVVYAPPGATAPSQSAQSCYAGPYVCPLQYAMPAGATCSCYSNQGQPIPGRAGG
jgi:hypothetical protein